METVSIDRHFGRYDERRITGMCTACKPRLSHANIQAPKRIWRETYADNSSVDA